MMTNYSKLHQRQAKSERNVVRLYELHEKASQDKNRRVLTFFNLRDDYGELLGPEEREYNIIFQSQRGNTQLGRSNPLKFFTLHSTN